jgi:AcrR family transcriptional regulator
MATEGPEDLRKWRLPRGRHGLPRELVARSQRERLLAAVVRVTATRGYDATTVADILEEAGVGRESFYEQFDDKLDCMMVAHTVLVDDLAERVRAAYAEPGEWTERLTRALAAALEWFAADTAAARFTLVEMGSVGTPARSRFETEFSRFIALLDEGLRGENPPPELAGATSLAVGGAFARVYEEIVLERTGGLPSLLPELAYETLVPFLGEEAARAAAG